MLTVIILLAIGAFIATVVSAAGKCQLWVAVLWVAVLLLCVIELVRALPAGR